MTDEWDDPGWDEPDWDEDWTQESTGLGAPPRSRLHHRVAVLMLVALLFPLAVQFLFVASTLTQRLGLMVVAVPTVIVALFLRGRTR